jgi:hypothetical protein
LHYYDSILVIEKRPIEEPIHLKTGLPEIPDYDPPKGLLRRLEKQIKQKIDRFTGRST